MTSLMLPLSQTLRKIAHYYCSSFKEGKSKFNCSCVRVRCSQLLQTRRGVPLCTYVYESIERSLEKSRNCSPLEADLCDVISGSGKSFWRGVDLTAGAQCCVTPPPPHGNKLPQHSYCHFILFANIYKLGVRS